MLVWDAPQGAPNIFTMDGARLSGDPRSAYESNFSQADVGNSDPSRPPCEGLLCFPEGQRPQRAVRRNLRPSRATRPRKAEHDGHRPKLPRNHTPCFCENPSIYEAAGRLCACYRSPSLARQQPCCASTAAGCRRHDLHRRSCAACAGDARDHKRMDRQGPCYRPHADQAWFPPASVAVRAVDVGYAAETVGSPWHRRRLGYLVVPGNASRRPERDRASPGHRARTHGQSDQDRRARGELSPFR